MSTMKAKHFHLIEDMDIAAMTFAAVERIEAVMGNVTAVFRTWARRSSDRRALAMMSDRMLNDIGLNHFDVRKEAGKFFWQK